MSLRIVVAGLAATYPVGGAFWDYLQYALGFARLGHEVLYLEDTGRWVYDPRASTFVATAERNAALLHEALKTLDPRLADCWFVRDAAGTTYGRLWPDVVEFCRSADVFVNVSAACFMRDEYFAARRVALVDSDPLYTQASVPDLLAGTIDPDARRRLEGLRRHDVFFTFAENIGAPDCAVPSDLFCWIPTRQPIVLDLFEAAVVPPEARRRVLTTVASWNPDEQRVLVGGIAYGGKSGEFERFIDLPRRSALPLELAVSGRPPIERLRARGWRVVDGQSVSADPWTYRRYLATSFGEWSVAKHAYVATRSGWFSCRTACYLALGVPAVVQDTGFGRIIPTGRGILSFSTVDEALAAIEALAADPRVHAAAAQDLAREYFDSDRVLRRLLDRILARST